MNSKLTGWGAVDEVPKEQLAFSPINTKLSLLSIDMKTKLVQYVERERERERERVCVAGSQLLSDIQTILVPCFRGLRK